MAQLTAGLYYRRDWRVVNLLTSSVVGALTIWAAQLLGPIGGSDPLGVDSATQYAETGIALPPSNSPPVGPLATWFNPATDVIPASGSGGSQKSDLMFPVGTVSTVEGLRG
jgi:hypothetical protein